MVLIGKLGWTITNGLLQETLCPNVSISWENSFTEEICIMSWFLAARLFCSDLLWICYDFMFPLSNMPLSFLFQKIFLTSVGSISV